MVGIKKKALPRETSRSRANLTFSFPPNRKGKNALLLDIKRFQKAIERSTKFETAAARAVSRIMPEPRVGLAPKAIIRRSLISGRWLPITIIQECLVFSTERRQG